MASRHSSSLIRIGSRGIFGGASQKSQKQLDKISRKMEKELKTLQQFEQVTHNNTKHKPLLGQQFFYGYQQNKFPQR